MSLSFLVFCCLFIFLTAGQNCSDGDIRLVGGGNEFEGRVEICFGEVWGTVCDDFWNTANAIVVCRQPGYLGGTEGTILFEYQCHDESGTPQILYP